VRASNSFSANVSIASPHHHRINLEPAGQGRKRFPW
jgi:hypothetical protein